MTDDQYWTDDSGDHRWGMYYLKETGPRIGLYITSQDDRGRDYVGESSRTMLRFFEPDGEDYERQLLPEERETVIFSTEDCSECIFGLFIVENNEVQGVYECGKINLRPKDKVDVGSTIVDSLRSTLEDD